MRRVKPNAFLLLVTTCHIRMYLSQENNVASLQRFYVARLPVSESLLIYTQIVIYPLTASKKDRTQDLTVTELPFENL